MYVRVKCVSNCYPVPMDACQGEVCFQLLEQLDVCHVEMCFQQLSYWMYITVKRVSTFQLLSYNNWMYVTVKRVSNC